MENKNLKKSILESERFGKIIGKSKAMLKVYEMLLVLAPSNLNTIIYGESGTGKELVARAIHDMSCRSKKPFVPVNCGAISESIIESEFFGYKKGAFTGAATDREGFLDLADGGSLFLDEIGDISLKMQVKLLRAIEGGGYTPVGSNQVKNADITIIGATNKNLPDLVKQGKIRADFYFRINIIKIQLPPLRDRKEDIPLLIGHFLRNSPDKHDITGLPQQVLHSLMDYSWPGNVRELQNVVNQYIALNRIDLPAMGEDTDVQNFIDDTCKSLSCIINRFEKKIIYNALVENGWNQSRVAKKLNIDRKTLASKIKKYGLKDL